MPGATMLRCGWVAVGFTCALLGGCARDLARSSSGAIGCPPESIAVSQVSVGWSQTSWSAQCNGTTFYCSGEGAASCTPEFGDAEAPPSGETVDAPTTADTTPAAAASSAAPPPAETPKADPSATTTAHDAAPEHMSPTEHPPIQPLDASEPHDAHPNP